jgi:hypothetical protein
MSGVTPSVSVRSLLSILPPNRARTRPKDVRTLPLRLGSNSPFLALCSGGGIRTPGTARPTMGHEARGRLDRRTRAR